LALAASILSPVVVPLGWDSFPISSYPMFSRGDVGTVNELAHVVLVRRDGSRVAAAPSLVGYQEPMVGMSVVRAHLERGTAGELCTSIAAHARDANVDAVGIEVVASVFDTRRYFSGDHAPLRREVHARCEVVP
jgi:hypothetical protein